MSLRERVFLKATEFYQSRYPNDDDPLVNHNLATGVDSALQRGHEDAKENPLAAMLHVDEAMRILKGARHPLLRGSAQCLLVIRDALEACVAQSN